MTTKTVSFNVIPQIIIIPSQQTTEYDTDEYETRPRSNTILFSTETRPRRNAIVISSEEQEAIFGLVADTMQYRSTLDRVTPTLEKMIDS